MKYSEIILIHLGSKEKQKFFIKSIYNYKNRSSYYESAPFTERIARKYTERNFIIKPIFESSSLSASTTVELSTDHFLPIIRGVCVQAHSPVPIVTWLTPLLSENVPCLTN